MAPADRFRTPRPASTIAIRRWFRRKNAQRDGSSCAGGDTATVRTNPPHATYAGDQCESSDAAPSRTRRECRIAHINMRIRIFASSCARIATGPARKTLAASQSGDRDMRRRRPVMPWRDIETSKRDGPRCATASENTSGPARNVSEATSCGALAPRHCPARTAMRCRAFVPEKTNRRSRGDAGSCCRPQRPTDGSPDPICHPFGGGSGAPVLARAGAPAVTGRSFPSASRPSTSSRRGR